MYNDCNMKIQKNMDSLLFVKLLIIFSLVILLKAI